MDDGALLLVTAVARARAFLAVPDATRTQLEPPHPAFTGFRRMAYVWSEGRSFQPIGDDVGGWLSFLRDRGVEHVVARLHPDNVAALTAGTGLGEVWEVHAADGAATMIGREATAAPGLDEVSLDEAADELLRALSEGGDARPEVARARAILASSGDGQEQSDVAWPYFVLPESAYSRAARRLFAAACAVWPEPLSAAAAREDPLLAAARIAARAAVNSGRAATDAPPGSGSPVQ